jgi:hypothetical protein
LQKYRLHTRRVPAASGTDQSVVVLGGLWMPQEQYNDSSKGDSMENDDDEKSENYRIHYFELKMIMYAKKCVNFDVKWHYIIFK